MGGTRIWGGAKWTGGRRRRTTNEITGASEAAALAATLGRELRAARIAARLTQAEVGRRIGVSHTRYGDIERGHGAGAPIGLWIAAGLAVGRPLAVTTTRSSLPELRDAGHLGPQETVIRLAADHGITGLFELQTRPAPNATYIDVGLRDDARRILEVIEVWNTLGDLGAGARLFKRKLAEAEEIAVVAGGNGRPYRVAGCWLLRATAANQALVRRYPAILRAQFPGSSAGWADALMNGKEPPDEPGLAWIDLANARIYEVRLAASATAAMEEPMSR